MPKVISLASTLFFLSTGVVLAGGIGGGGGLPWDAPLTLIQTDLSGVTATSISLIAVVVVFGVLIFGGELNHFARTLCFIVMAASVLVAGNAVLAGLGIAGAQIDSDVGYDVYGFISGMLITSLIWTLGLYLRRKLVARRRIASSQMSAGHF